MNRRLDIDARMLNRSGIGVCLKNWLPRLGGLSRVFEVHVHGPELDLRSMCEQYSLDFQVHAKNDRPYTLRETLRPLGMLRPIENLWVPHYNAPWFGVKNLLVTIHDVLHLRDDIVRRNSLQRMYAYFTMAMVRKNAMSVMFDSVWTCEEFKRYVGKPRRERIVYLGVSDRWHDLYLKPPKSEFKFPYFLFVGNQVKHKNLSFLLECYLKVANRCECDLVIAGRMENLNAIDRHPVLTGAIAHTRVHVLGEVPQNRLESLVRHASSLVFPSLYEGFGLPPLEALACGTPVLASDIPVHREVLGDDATYFDPRDPDDLQRALLSSKKIECARVLYRWEDSARKIQEECEKCFLA